MWSSEFSLSRANVSAKQQEFFFMTVTSSADEGCWILDSGASSHISNDLTLFHDICDVEPIVIGLAGVENNGKHIYIRATQRGSVKLNVVNGQGMASTVTLRDVLFVPDATANIISVSKITAVGGSVEFNGDNFTISSRDGTVVAEGIQSGGNIYLLRATSTTPVENLTTVVEVQKKEAAELWHRRLGHLNLETIRRMSKGAVVGVNLKYRSVNASVCAVCAKGKQTRLTFYNATKRSSKSSMFGERPKNLRIFHCSKYHKKGTYGHICNFES